MSSRTKTRAIALATIITLSLIGSGVGPLAAAAANNVTDDATLSIEDGDLLQDETDNIAITLDADSIDSYEWKLDYDSSAVQPDYESNPAEAISGETAIEPDSVTDTGDSIHASWNSTESVDGLVTWAISLTATADEETQTELQWNTEETEISGDNGTLAVSYEDATINIKEPDPEEQNTEVQRVALSETDKTVINTQSQHYNNADFNDPQINLIEDNITQELTTDINIKEEFANEHDTTELLIDIEESVEQGLEARDIQIAGLDPAEEPKINNPAGEISISFDPDSYIGESSITFDIKFEGTIEDESPLVNDQIKQGENTIHHSVELAGSSKDTTYTLLYRGATAISPEDAEIRLGETSTNEIHPTPDGNSSSINEEFVGGAFKVWHNQTITFVAENASNRAEIREYETATVDGERQILSGSLVSQVGTAPSKVTNIRTERLDPNQRYIIEFPDNPSRNATLLDLRSLNLTADITQSEIQSDEQIEVNVSSEDLTGAETITTFSDETESPPEVVHTTKERLDGFGERKVKASPENDLNVFWGDNISATVYHNHSEISAEAGSATVIEPFDEIVTVETPEIKEGESFARGGIIPIELDLQKTDVARVQFGQQFRENVEFTTTVRDVDEDGSATFYINTFQIGDDSRNHGVFAPDESTQIVNVTAHDGMALGGGSQGGGVIAPGAYSLSVATKDDDGAAFVNRQIVQIQPRETGNISMYKAPGYGPHQESFLSGQEIANSIEDGTLTPMNSSVSENDQMVIALESGGINGILHETAIRDPSIDNPGEIIQTMDSKDISNLLYNTSLIQADINDDIENADEYRDFIDITATEINSPPNQAQYQYDVENATKGIYTHNGDLESETIYIRLDLESTSNYTYIDRNTTRDAEMEPGDEIHTEIKISPPVGDHNLTNAYNPPIANVTQREDGFIKEHHEGAEFEWTYTERKADVTPKLPELTLLKDGIQTLRGNTTLTPGHEVRVEVYALTDDQGSNIIHRAAPPVRYDEDAEQSFWQTGVDVSDVPADTPLEIHLYHGNKELTEEPIEGVVRDSEQVHEFTVNNQEQRGDVVRIEDFNTTLGGHVAIYNESNHRIGWSNRIDPERNTSTALSLDKRLQEPQELRAQLYLYEGEPYTGPGGLPVEDEFVLTPLDADEQITPIVIRDITPSSTVLEDYRDIDITATIENTEGNKTTELVEIRFDNMVETQEVTIGANETVTVEQTIETRGLIRGQMNNFTVEAGGDVSEGQVFIEEVTSGDDNETGTDTETPTGQGTDDSDSIDETPGANQTDNETQDETPNQELTPPTSDDDDDGGIIFTDDAGNGFGIVIALLAILGTGYIAKRRNGE